MKTIIECIKRFMKPVLIAGVSISVLAGCTANVRTKVNTFIANDAVIGKGSIAVRPMVKTAEGTLEFDFYKNKLEQRLTAAGYTINEQSPQQVAKLGYSVMQKENGGFRNGTLIYGGGIGYNHFFHRGGLVFSQQIRDRDRYERQVQLTITTAGPSETNILEIKAVSLGSCENLQRIFGPMLDGVFNDLRRPNGSIVNVKAQGGSGC